MLLFNRRARALRGLEVLPEGPDLVARWDIRKRVELTSYPDMGALSRMDRISILLDQLRHRGDFLIPFKKRHPALNA
jgi:hypothetical protein